MDETILEVKNLNTSFDTENGRINVVKNVCFSLKKGKTLGIVGESGCGKSVTSLSIMRLLPKPAGKIESGEILLNGENMGQVNYCFVNSKFSFDILILVKS